MMIQTPYLQECKDSEEQTAVGNVDTDMCAAMEPSFLPVSSFTAEGGPCLIVEFRIFSTSRPHLELLAIVLPLF